MSRRFICFALSVMLILTFIPQITFAAEEDEIDVTAGEEITEEVQEEGVSEEPVQDEEGGVITGFAPLDTSEYYYEGDPEEGELAISLPGMLGVFINGSDQISFIPVSWEAVEDFDHTDFYFYSMKPVWNDNFILSDDINELMDVPWITVYKQEPENDNIEPILTEDELDPLYTEEDGPVDPETGEPVETVDEEFIGPDEEDLCDPDAPNGAEQEPTDAGEPAVQEEEVQSDSTDASDTSGFSLKAFACDTAGEAINALTDDAYADKATNTAAIYRFLTQTMGLNTAAACGVMININAESAMSPINLQNTYNSRFGLSDSAYTKAVDKGKGSYKTSGGKVKNFKTDSGGYGLCQWTSAGRKTNLLKKAIAEKKSIGDINMQLAFLRTELQSYPSVLTTLQHVPNNAAGAYIAAAQFCLVFEAPANTISTAEARGRNCLSTYWKTYSKSVASVSSAGCISLCGYSYPTAVKKGKGMDVTGYAVSNCKIKTLTGKIVNSSKKAVYSKTVKPNTTAYKLANLDSAMKFAKLGPGEYTYVLTAKDVNGKTVSASRKFKVASTYTATTKALGFASAAGTSTATTAKPAAQTKPTTQTTTTKSAAKKPAAKVKKAYSGSFPKLPKRGYFKKGDKGKQVKKLQKFLKWYGYKVNVDGKCGKKTINTVKKFQKSVGLKATGRFGKKALAKAKKVKK